MEQSSPEIAFLGFAERASSTQDELLPMTKWNILGLKQVIPFPFFPASFAGVVGVIAVRGIAFGQTPTLRIVNDEQNEVGTLSFAFDAAPADAAPVVGQPSTQVRVVTIPSGWTPFSFRFADSFFISKPGIYKLLLSPSGAASQVSVGEFVVAHVQRAPFSQAEITALKSDPAAVKAAVIIAGCKFCDSKLEIYAAFERSTKLEAEGKTWYQDIPDHFVCGCGKADIDLTDIRANMFAVIGLRSAARSSSLTLVPEYEASSFVSVRNRFNELLAQAKNEEAVQKFIEDHPILLHQFVPQRIFFKPAISTAYRADFGILTVRNELLLVEIERPGMRLMKKNGDQSADLTHAIDQVERWLHTTDEHKYSVLSDLKLTSSQIVAIRGVVIAGRDKGNDAAALRRLKGSDRGRLSFMTFDDLLAGLDATAREFARL